MGYHHFVSQEVKFPMTQNITFVAGTVKEGRTIPEGQLNS